MKSRGVDFHDLTMIFRDHPEPLYIDNCCHVSEEGYSLVAEKIGEAIIERQERDGGR